MRMFDRATPAEQRRADDLHHLRMLAWCVQRDKYRAEPRRIEGGRRGAARMVTLTFHVEMADYAEADRAVREIVDGRGRAASA